LRAGADAKVFKKFFIPILIWGLAPAGLAALFFYLQMGILSLCVYAFYVLLAGARIMTLLWMKPLQCARHVSDEVIRIGETVKVVARIRNPHWFPILWAYVEETLPEKMRIEGTTKRLIYLAPGETAHLFYSVSFTRRGCHRIGPVVIETGDIFGFFRKTRMEKQRDFVTVLPEYTEIESFQIGQRRMLGDFCAERSLFDDPSRIRGIREYQRGDSLKRIHWKSTAHTGSLLSKVYDPIEVAGATIVLDFHKNSWIMAEQLARASGRIQEDTRPTQETALETACSIARYLWEGGWSVGLLSNGRDPLGIPGITLAQARSMESLGEALEAARAGRVDDRLEPVFIPARRASEQFSLIHENLARLELTDGLRIEYAILDAIPRIERRQVLAILTGDCGDAFIEAVLKTRALGYRIMVFIVRNTAAHDRAFEAFIPAGIEVFDLEHERRLSEIATGRRFY